MIVKRLSLMISFLLIIFSVWQITPAEAAEYEVKEGDTLTGISELTGHSVEQLVLMNEIEDPDLIFIGQTITFISDDDLLAARTWCKHALKTTLGDHNRDFFKSAIQHLDNENIRYSYSECGLHFDLILRFAEACTIL